MGARIRVSRIAAGLALAALVGCSGSEETTVPRDRSSARDGAGAVAAHADFLDAIRAADAGRAAAFLDRSTELVLFPMRGRSRLEGFEDAKRGLEGMLSALRGGEWTFVHTRPEVRGGTAWITYHFAVETGGREPLLGRATEVWVHRDDGWKLTHGHWSEEPGSR